MPDWDTSDTPAQLQITGDWTLAHYADLKRQSEQSLHGRYDDSTHIDLNGLGALDTAGASLLVELLGPSVLGSPPSIPIAPCPRPTAPCCKPSIAR